MIFRSLLLAAALLTAGLPRPVSAQTAPQMTTRDSTDEGDELMSLLDEEDHSGKEYVTATFKATRIINGHSIENVGKGILDFRVSHRFGTLNQGIGDFFGLDNATTRIAFDYGITNWLMVGVGRTSLNKEYDGYVKARILRQTADNAMPFSLSYVGSMMVRTEKVTLPNPDAEYFFTNRLAYSNQLLVARKFSDRFSLQLMPVHVHLNLVDRTEDPNDIFALGIGGRIKLNQRFSLNGEYFYVFNQTEGYRNSLSVGVDIETGGHVFQLHFTNSTGMTDRAAIARTTGRWDNGDIHFGFNISRVFTVVRPKEFQGSRNRIY